MNAYDAVPMVLSEVTRMWKAGQPISACSFHAAWLVDLNKNREVPILPFWTYQQVIHVLPGMSHRTQEQFYRLLTFFERHARAEQVDIPPAPTLINSKVTP